MAESQHAATPPPDGPNPLDLDLDSLNAAQANNMIGLLGIEVTEVLENGGLKGRMPVDHRTVQTFGQLHGGASVALAETLGSFAANLAVDQNTQYCVGLEINANHIRAVRQGWVYATALPEHRGRSTQVWTIRIVDEQDRLVCTSRLTMAVRQRPA